jgi:hypothetical protein
MTDNRPWKKFKRTLWQGLPKDLAKQIVAYAIDHSRPVSFEEANHIVCRGCQKNLANAPANEETKTMWPGPDFLKYYISLVRHDIRMRSCADEVLGTCTTVGHDSWRDCQWAIGQRKKTRVFEVWLCSQECVEACGAFPTFETLEYIEYRAQSFTHQLAHTTRGGHYEMQQFWEVLTICRERSGKTWQYKNLPEGQKCFAEDIMALSRVSCWKAWWSVDYLLRKPRQH